jgi:plastocyanin
MVSLSVMAGSPASGLAATYEVTIAQMKFGAVPALHVGDVITWRNNDIFRHTVTARDKSFDVDLPPNAERNMTVMQVGNVEFYCRFHPMMKGTLSVQP